jgi:hypothetical protein
VASGSDGVAHQAQNQATGRDLSTSIPSPTAGRAARSSNHVERFHVMDGFAIPNKSRSSYFSSCPKSGVAIAFSSSMRCALSDHRTQPALQRQSHYHEWFCFTLEHPPEKSEAPRNGAGDRLACGDYFKAGLVVSGCRAAPFRNDAVASRTHLAGFWVPVRIFICGRLCT